MRRPAWLGPLVALLVVYAVFALITPEHSFLRSQIFLTMARQSVVVAICALGMTLVIVTGGIDLSTGSLVALTTVVLAKLLKGGSSPVVAVAVRGRRRDAPSGRSSGVCVGRFRLMPFVVTLGAMAVLRGVGDRARVRAEDRLRPARPRSRPRGLALAAGHLDRARARGGRRR